MKIFYRRNLPHLQLPHATYSVVFRLIDSLPKNIVDELKVEYHKIRQTSILTDQENKEIVWRHKVYFERFDEYLQKWAQPKNWLNKSEIAEIIAEVIMGYDNDYYELIAFCIMPNHVHMIIKEVKPFPGSVLTATDTQSKGLLDDYPLSRILKRIKGVTAHEANKILNRSGSFWHHESYDHVIRCDEELKRQISYVLNNPVKAGLVNDWTDWKWTYYKYKP